MKRNPSEEIQFSKLNIISQIPPENIYGGEYAVIAYQAYNDWMQGSISWQIYKQETNHPVTKEGRNGEYGRRLNVAYYIPYKYVCRNRNTI